MTAIIGAHSAVIMSSNIDRLYAVVTAVAVADITFGGATTVGLNLWIADGPAAYVIVAGYLSALAVIAIDPDVAPANLIAAGLGFAFWVGRTAAFVGVWLDDRPNLRSAVIERTAWVIIHVLWHTRAARSIALRQAIQATDAR